MDNHTFELQSSYAPAGDQPRAIDALTAGLARGDRAQTLLGVTGSGKTFTIANVIQNVQRPTLVIAHNKTLAAQLAQEFRTFFPRNAVEYFVSYYDYYQPEAYVSATDTYIEKETQINEEIDRLRHAATAAVLTRRDVIVVASVSCIYGLGSPDFYRASLLELRTGSTLSREDLITRLVDVQYLRADILARGRFRARGETVEIVPAGQEVVLRVELFGDTIDRISEHDLTTGEKLRAVREALIYPAKHFVVPGAVMERALGAIEAELVARVKELEAAGKIVEATRLERRTRQDIAMMRSVGYCSGIENYARYLSGRAAGEAPYTLMDYFPDDYLLVIDESHVTVPQIGGMSSADRARKEHLVEHGFRLPSALDNRPLTFAEFEERARQTIFVSATPADYERAHSTQVVEQVIRPTGLVDPELVVRPTRTQVRDVIDEARRVIARGQRVLITTLTKKQAEDLSTYLAEHDIAAAYVHSDVDTLERVAILEDLRRGTYDVLVGVNLLREGLDLPEVALVAILDADQEGFLRSETSLIQTIGRAARNVEGRVILYADTVKGGLSRAIAETERRRAKQLAYNKKHGITPRSVAKAIGSIAPDEASAHTQVVQEYTELASLQNLTATIKQKEREMRAAAQKLQFEQAAALRDELRILRKLQKQ